MIERIRAEALSIPFRQAFKHAAAERAATQTVWVVAQGGAAAGHGEGCPREYVTGESVESAREFIAAHAESWCRTLRDPATLRQWVQAHAADIDRHPAAWTAVELAILDLFAQRLGVPVEAMLGLPPVKGKFRYAAVLGDAAPEAFAAQLERYLQAGFRQFKIKLSGDPERDRAKVRLLREHAVAPAEVRADANNLWREAGAAIAALRALGFPFFALEEPIAAGDYAGMAQVAAELGCRIIVDESMARPAQLESLPGPGGRWIANLRVSKMGGVLRSLEFLQAARRAGVGIIVGAHVGETGVLTRAALPVAAAAGDALVSQEGAFGTHLLAHDMVEPPLMFGAAGVLDTGPLPFDTAPGWGLSPR